MFQDPLSNPLRNRPAFLVRSAPPSAVRSPCRCPSTSHLRRRGRSYVLFFVCLERVPKGFVVGAFFLCFCWICFCWICVWFAFLKGIPKGKPPLWVVQPQDRRPIRFRPVNSEGDSKRNTTLLLFLGGVQPQERHSPILPPRKFKLRLAGQLSRSETAVALWDGCDSPFRTNHGEALK